MRQKKMLDHVESLGLAEFGQQSRGLGQGPGHMSPVWGVVIGGGVAGLTRIGLAHTQTGSLQINADVIGLGTGLAAAGILYAMPKTRGAALGAALGALFASGLAWLERVLLNTVQLPLATAQTASTIAAAATNGSPAMSGLGIARTRQLGLSTTRALNGLGLSTTANVPRSVGTIPGVAGPSLTSGRTSGQPPINLMGPRSAGAAQVQLMGGPQIHGISGHWGANHFAR